MTNTYASSIRRLSPATQFTVENLKLLREATEAHLVLADNKPGLDFDNQIDSYQDQNMLIRRYEECGTLGVTASPDNRSIFFEADNQVVFTELTEDQLKITRLNLDDPTEHFESTLTPQKPADPSPGHLHFGSDTRGLIAVMDTESL